MKSLIIPSLKPTCGTCEFAAATPDLAVIVCQGVPPTPCIIGAQQTVRGVEFNVEMMVPRLPRAQKACAFWRQKASDLN
jgi:hypothetical protein